MNAPVLAQLLAPKVLHIGEPVEVEEIERYEQEAREYAREASTVIVKKYEYQGRHIVAVFVADSAGVALDDIELDNGSPVVGGREYLSAYFAELARSGGVE